MAQTSRYEMAVQRANRFAVNSHWSGDNLYTLAAAYGCAHRQALKDLSRPAEERSQRAALFLLQCLGHLEAAKKKEHFTGPIGEND